MFTQACNRCHGCSGHLFQGRFNAILVDADDYLLALARYVVINPVRAPIVDDPAEWPWSSYRAMAGEVPVPQWLAVNRLRRRFAHRGDATGSLSRKASARRALTGGPKPT